MKNCNIFWLTGLSGAGKSTLAEACSNQLEPKGISYKLLDGDVIREEFNSNLGFSPEDIKAQNRSVVELCKKYSKEHSVILVSVITPFRSSRKNAKEILGKNYHEIYIRASLSSVIERDVKGLYKKALNGEISNFIGICAETPYEEPPFPSLIIDTEHFDMTNCSNKLTQYIINNISSD